MKQVDIARAWRDQAYYESLSEEERAQVPENPAGERELSDEEFEEVAGGVAGTHYSFCDPTSCEGSEKIGSL